MRRPRYISVCSGIEAVTVAAHDMMDAAAFCEYEAFPSAVLSHHYPDVPNMGDLTKWRDWSHELLADADILVGGTPCQAFSVAGLRNSLADDRGNLSLEFVRLADAIDDLRLRGGKQPAVIVWENVPGVLSVKDNAFGCFLAALAGEDTPLVPTGGRWTDAGMVIGPERAVAWRILDAQYFGLAQRRRRVFVVACPRDGADPREILFEREGLRRDTPPSREAGQGFAHDVAPCIGASGRGFERGGDTRGQDPVVASCITGPITHALKAGGFDGSEDGTGRGQPIVCQEVADTITNCFHKHHGASGGKDCLPRNHVACFGGNNTHGPIDVATARNASGSASGRLDFESETFAVAVRTANTGANGHGISDEMAHTLDRAQGQAVIAFRDDVTPKHQEELAFTLTQPSPSGGGHPQSVMTLAIRGRGEGSNLEIREDGTANALLTPTGGRGGIGVGAVAFHENQRAEVTLNDTVGSLKVGGGKPGQGYPAIAFNGDQSEKTRSMGEKEEQTPTLRADGPCHVATAMQVRRLTCEECEFLQGFPRNYTLIPWKNKPAEVCPDGPRYKALGNSMAVPCMAFIGRRIAMVAARHCPANHIGLLPGGTHRES